MELTDDDVLEILKLFEQSKFDFLQLEQGERKITVSKGGYTSAGMGGPGAAIASERGASSQRGRSSSNLDMWLQRRGPLTSGVSHAECSSSPACHPPPEKRTPEAADAVPEDRIRPR